MDTAVLYQAVCLCDVRTSHHKCGRHVEQKCLSLRHEPHLFRFSLVKSEPTWQRPEEVEASGQRSIILLQIVVRAVIASSHLLGPVLLGCCRLRLTSLSSVIVLRPPLLWEGWGGHPLCLSGYSSVLMDLYWPCCCTTQSSTSAISRTMYVQYVMCVCACLCACVCTCVRALMRAYVRVYERACYTRLCGCVYLQSARTDLQL